MPTIPMWPTISKAIPVFYPIVCVSFIILWAVWVVVGVAVAAGVAAVIVGVFGFVRTIVVVLITGL